MKKDEPHPYKSSGLEESGVRCIEGLSPGGAAGISCGKAADHPIHGLPIGSKVDARCFDDRERRGTIVETRRVRTDREYKITFPENAKFDGWFSEHVVRPGHVDSPADPMGCCAAETDEGVTVHERNCPRFTPEAVAYRRARQSEVQQLMSQRLTPAEERTGIRQRRTTAALADVADLRRELNRVLDYTGTGVLAALDRIEQALRAGGTA